MTGLAAPGSPGFDGLVPGPTAASLPGGALGLLCGPLAKEVKLPPGTAADASRATFGLGGRRRGYIGMLLCTELHSAYRFERCFSGITGRGEFVGISPSEHGVAPA